MYRCLLISILACIICTSAQCDVVLKSIEVISDTVNPNLLTDAGFESAATSGIPAGGSGIGAIQLQRAAWTAAASVLVNA